MDDIELSIVEDGKEAYEWRFIASCSWPDERGDIPRKQVEANARLIAAAPDLLEALEEARTTLSILRTQVRIEIGRCADPAESRWDGVPEKIKEQIDQIDAAILKTKDTSHG